MSKVKKAVIYTDVLLEDLCAIEYVIKNLEEVYIIVVSADELKSSDFASTKITDFQRAGRKFFDWGMKYKTKVYVCNGDYQNSYIAELTDWMDTADINETKPPLTISIAPATTLIRDFNTIDNKMPSQQRLLDNVIAMIGQHQGEKFGEDDEDEWNASEDLTAFKELVVNSKNIYVYTYDRCIQLHEEFGIPEEMEFQEEYNTKMSQLDDLTTNFELQAVFYGLKDFEANVPSNLTDAQREKVIVEVDRLRGKSTKSDKLDQTQKNEQNPVLNALKFK